MAHKNTRTTRKLEPRHRARKPRPVRPLGARKANNHEDRHAEEKAAREALIRAAAVAVAPWLPEVV